MSRNTRRAAREGTHRRTFVKTVAYVAPAILTLDAVPSFAAYGSAPPQTWHSGKKSGQPYGGSSFDPPGQLKKEEKKKNGKGKPAQKPGK